MNVQFEGDKVIIQKSDFIKLLGGTGIETVVERKISNGFTTDINEVTNYLDAKGFKRNVKGFDFLRSAIILAINKPNILRYVTKELYPEVAKEFGTTPSRVERAMRHSIEITFEDAPCNSEFIALAADKIRLKKMEAISNGV